MEVSGIQDVSSLKLKDYIQLTNDLTDDLTDDLMSNNYVNRIITTMRNEKDRTENSSSNDPFADQGNNIDKMLYAIKNSSDEWRIIFYIFNEYYKYDCKIKHNCIKFNKQIYNIFNLLCKYSSECVFPKGNTHTIYELHKLREIIRQISNRLHISPSYEFMLGTNNILLGYAEMLSWSGLINISTKIPFPYSNNDREAIFTQNAIKQNYLIYICKVLYNPDIISIKQPAPQQASQLVSQRPAISYAYDFANQSYIINDINIITANDMTADEIRIIIKLLIDSFCDVTSHAYLTNDIVYHTVVNNDLFEYAVNDSHYLITILKFLYKKYNIFPKYICEKFALQFIDEILTRLTNDSTAPYSADMLITDDENKAVQLLISSGTKIIIRDFKMFTSFCSYGYSFGKAYNRQITTHASKITDINRYKRYIPMFEFKIEPDSSIDNINPLNVSAFMLFIINCLLPTDLVYGYGIDANITDMKIRDLLIKDGVQAVLQKYFDDTGIYDRYDIEHTQINTEFASRTVFENTNTVFIDRINTLFHDNGGIFVISNIALNTGVKRAQIIKNIITYQQTSMENLVAMCEDIPNELIIFKACLHPNPLGSDGLSDFNDEIKKFNTSITDSMSLIQRLSIGCINNIIAMHSGDEVSVSHILVSYNNKFFTNDTDQSDGDKPKSSQYHKFITVIRVFLNYIKQTFIQTEHICNKQSIHHIVNVIKNLTHLQSILISIITEYRQYEKQN